MRAWIIRGSVAAVALALVQFLALNGQSEEGQTGQAAGSFEETVVPFLEANCYACHSDQVSSAGLNLERHASGGSVLADRRVWERVVARVRAGEMPPAFRERPDDQQMAAATGWIEDQFARADGAAGPNPGRVVARRLNRTEYNNTVRDLLGVDTDPAQDFPQDDAIFGFDNIANALTVSPLLMEKYLAAAEKVATQAVMGPPLETRKARFVNAPARRFEYNNAIIIQSPAPYSMEDYDESGIHLPGAFHLHYKVPVEADYNITIETIGQWPQGTDPHFLDIYMDGERIKTLEVPNLYTRTGEKYFLPMNTRLHLPAGEHYFIAALPRMFDGLPENYRGPNPSKVPVPQREFPPLPEDATPEQIAGRERAIERANSFVPKFWGNSVGEISFTGPFDAEPGVLPGSEEKVYVCGRTEADRDTACLRRIIEHLTTRAYRRPVAKAEVDGLVALAEDAQRRDRSWQQSLALAVQAILMSPDFLFRIEHEPTGEGVYRLNDYEIASRLSYFLWSTMPDGELFAEAQAGRLHDRAALETQVRRMLTDPRSKALAQNFASQWLETRRLESVAPDRDTFPDFDEYLRYSMQQETELFFDYIAREDRPVTDLIDGKYTFLNQWLAQHYGIEGVYGTDFRLVNLEDQPAGKARSGVLTQAGVLTVSSYANRTSPVLRGKWILENLLNTPPPPPPPNVPPLEQNSAGSAASLRAQMEAHRANPACASCHSKLDPLGFALENFDGVGAWREMDGETKIDPSGQLPDGTAIAGADDLKAVLAADPDKFTATLTEKLFVYALGRGVGYQDRATIQEIVRRTAANDYRFSSIILGIVDSMPFQMQKAEPAAGGASEPVQTAGVQ